VSGFFEDRPWTGWPDDIRCHTAAAVRRYQRELSGAISHFKFLQYIFSRQWQGIRDYAHENGVSLIGDVPMFVAHNSADCWAHQELFDLDANGMPVSVAGVPPDYFSADGQLWGNPLYDYETMAADGYDWWVQRFRFGMTLVDEVRIDHFRGFEAFWAVPAQAETAKNGVWKKGPGLELFRAVYQKLGHIPLIAEDLGIITDDVCELRETLRLPGMKVLQFHMTERTDGVFCLDTEPSCLVYTGTHDNNTTLGWYTEDLTPSQQLQVRQAMHVGENTSPQEIVRALITYVYRRRAETAVIPMQDLLGLPSSCRMNIPGVSQGNWHWQMDEGMLKFDIAKWLSALCKQYKR
jgi:4-alpha-glucanotransferase